MNNEPVAWIDEETGCFVYSQYDYEDLDEHGKDGLIPLYTHPVNTCKHGVDDGACKECYLEVTNPANPYQSITDTKIEPTVVSYTHPAELTDEEIISTMVQFDVYSSDDHLLIEAGRAILRKAQNG